MLKKAPSSVLAILPCSRTESTIRAPSLLRRSELRRPGITAALLEDFFDHSPKRILTLNVSFWKTDPIARNTDQGFGGKASFLEASSVLC